jgi:hypothetical protein
MGLVDKLNETLNRGVSETERMLEIGKVKTRISTLGKSREELLTALGAVAYEQWRSGASDPSAFGTLGEKVRAVELEVAQLKTRLDELEGTRDAGRVACPACGESNAHGAAFCTKCGTPVPVASAQPACGACGAVLPEGGKFCMRCGTPVAEAAPVDQEVSADGAADSQEEQA